MIPSFKSYFCHHIVVLFHHHGNLPIYFVANHLNKEYMYSSQFCLVRFMEEGYVPPKKSKHHQNTASDDVEMLSDFRRPRNSVLCIVAEFYHHSYNRIKELKRLIRDPGVRCPELLDYKAHNVCCINMAVIG